MRGRKDYMFLQGEMIISGIEKLVEEHLFQEENMCFLLRETRFFTELFLFKGYILFILLDTIPHSHTVFEGFPIS